jgi:hypothetical protein
MSPKTVVANGESWNNMILFQGGLLYNSAGKKLGFNGLSSQIWFCLFVPIVNGIWQLDMDLMDLWFITQKT